MGRGTAEGGGGVTWRRPAFGHPSTTLRVVPLPVASRRGGKISIHPPFTREGARPPDAFPEEAHQPVRTRRRRLRPRRPAVRDLDSEPRRHSVRATARARFVGYPQLRALSPLNLSVPRL